MHPFMKRIQALETGGANAAVELVAVELALDERNLPCGDPIWAEWRGQRFERLADEAPSAFRARVREAVGNQLSPQAARQMLFIEGSDRFL